MKLKHFRKPGIGMATQLEEGLIKKCEIRIDWEKSIMIGDSGYKKGVDEGNEDGEPADDHSNADRLFAKNLKIIFQEPKDFFGWKNFFGIFNIQNETELKDFLGLIDKEINRLRETGEDEARLQYLKREVLGLRSVNKFPTHFRFVHFNIKELTTAKLLEQNNVQVISALDTLKLLDGDLLSINELQFDLPDVPTRGLPGTGLNVSRILSLLGQNSSNWSWTFAEANTGKNAKRLPSGDYFSDPESIQSREFADQVNFGVFPGEYSTAFTTTFSINKGLIFSSLLWKAWNPQVDLEKFKLPLNTTLFDKNFNDSLLDLNGKMFHVITFHTVPAYHFGDPNSPNYLRNQDQLEFLEWYLLGECNPTSASIVRQCVDENGPRPLPKGVPFIVVGDLNVDIESDNPGAEVLKRLFDRPEIQDWMPEIQDLLMTKKHVTHFMDGIDIDKYKNETDHGQSHLDYFLISSHFKILDGSVYAPLSEFQEHGCFGSEALAEKRALQVSESITKNNLNRVADISKRWPQWCVVSTTTAFFQFRHGSDHLPVFVDLSLE